MTAKETLALWDAAVWSHRDFLVARGFVMYERIMVEVSYTNRLRSVGMESPLRVGGYV